MSGPAFVLGNGPFLPVEHLECLKGHFTIGVNRILLSGFEPTVLFWVDNTVHREAGKITPNGKRMLKSPSLMVCDRSVWEREGWIGLKTWTGDSAWKHESTPTELCCNGNTGCAAARWALALGCSPVYLVGMSALYHEDRTNFYGENPWHNRGEQGTTWRMQAEMGRLIREHGDQIISIRDGRTLTRLAAAMPQSDQEWIRRHLREVLCHGA